MAQVKPAKADHYEFAQSNYPQLPEIPFRAIVAAPSGAGKTVLLQSMVLDLYRTNGGKSPFSRIYIWSPSVYVDPAWKPVEQFVREELGVDESVRSPASTRTSPRNWRGSSRRSGAL